MLQTASAYVKLSMHNYSDVQYQEFSVGYYIRTLINEQSS